MKPNTTLLMNTVLCRPDDTWVILDRQGEVLRSGSDINAYARDLFEGYCRHNATQGEDTRQFADGRYAFALLPGEYWLDLDIGYYTSLLGLGQKPDDVVIHGKVEVPNSANGKALDNFWRSCEGVTIHVGGDGRNHWRVSQAAPFRRNVVHGTLVFGQSTPDELGYASGGFVGECAVRGVGDRPGRIDMGTQQQFYVGSTEFDELRGGSWNFLMAGTRSGPISDREMIQGGKLNTCRGPIESMAAKPYLMARGPDEFELVVPKFHSQVEGPPSYDDGSVTKTKRFTIVDPEVSVEEVNEALSDGYSVVFSPGIYRYPQPLEVFRPGTVLLGLGLATLVPTQGTAAIIVDAAGCRVAGLMIQAGPRPAGKSASPCLVAVGGMDGPREGDPEQPTLLQDVFCRVGGPDLDGECETMLLVNQSHTILEDTWSWRADHTDAVRDGLGVERAKVDHCLVVNGDSVTCYCLMIEHSLKELCVWNGHHGRVLFIQSELAYDVGDGGETWDYPGLRVTGRGFYGAGLGFYSFFSKTHEATEEHPAVSSAVVVPEDAVIDSAMTVFLNSEDGGGVIRGVINGRGQPTDGASPGIPSWCAHRPGQECKVCSQPLPDQRPDAEV